MAFSRPEVDSINWGEPLQKHLAQLNDPQYGGFNRWAVRPTIGVDGQPLGQQHKGYTGYNESSFMFETWDGEKWDNYDFSMDVDIVATSDINLDLTEAYTFTVTASGYSTGWGWDNVITSNKPFNVPVKTTQQFFTADKLRSFTVSSGLSEGGWQYSATKFASGNLTQLIGQSFTVFKRIPNPSSPVMRYRTYNSEQASEWISISGSTVSSVSQFSDAINIAGNYTTINFVVDANSYSILQQFANSNPAFILRLLFPSENRGFIVQINNLSFSLGNNRITAIIRLPVPSGFVEQGNAHWIPPTTVGNIEYLLPEKRTIREWGPFGISHTYRLDAAIPTFPGALSLSTHTSNQPNVYPVTLTLTGSGGWSWAGLNSYNGHSAYGGNSGIEFWCRTYAANIYPNQPGINYIPVARMFLHTNGNLGLGDELRNPASKLHVIGNIQATGTITANSTASDIRLKENIVPLSGIWPALKEIKPFAFTWKKDFVVKEATPESQNDDGTTRVAEPEVLSDYLPDGIFTSYSAQDIEEMIYPEAVVEDGYGIKHLRLEALVPFLHTSLIEVEEEINGKLNNIMKDISEIKARLTQIEKTIK